MRHVIPTLGSIKLSKLTARQLQKLFNNVREHEKHPDSPYLFASPRTGDMYHPDSIATDTQMMNTSSSSYSTPAAGVMSAIPNPTDFVIEPKVLRKKLRTVSRQKCSLTENKIILHYFTLWKQKTKVMRFVEKKASRYVNF